jgi:hypothetical protein
MMPVVQFVQALFVGLTLVVDHQGVVVFVNGDFTYAGS